MPRVGEGRPAEAALTRGTGHQPPVTSRWLPVTSHQSRVASQRSPVTGHQSRVTSHGSPVTGHRSPVTSHGSPVTGHGVSVTRHRSPVARHRSPVASHQLLVTRRVVRSRSASLTAKRRTLIRDRDSTLGTDSVVDPYENDLSVEETPLTFTDSLLVMKSLRVITDTPGE